jgi:uncharacterized protein YodC (DUF2158 family)
MKFPVESKTKKKRGNPEDKNKILKLVDYTIPYVKELRQLPLVKSVTACILMQQLDYWINIQAGKKFYKFLEPCDNQRAYKPGDSWTEELGMSADEFKTAFGQIGVSYKSKAQYDAAPDKFQGKYYCSYFNRVNRETLYFRNDELVDRDLNNLFLGNGESQSVEAGKIDSVEVDSFYSVEDDISSLVENETIALESTETTSDNTSKTTTDNTSKREEEKSHSPDERSKTEEEIINKKDIDNRFYSTSLNIEDCYDKSENSEVIEGIPVIDEPYSYSQTSRTAGHLPDDFKVTDEMLEWIEVETQRGNVASGIDINHATQKFIVHNQGKKHRFWIQQWKLWMMNERPKQAAASYMNASQRQVEQFRRLAEEDPYADLDDNDNSFYTPYMNASQRQTEQFRRLEEKDNYADVTD